MTNNLQVEIHVLGPPLKTYRQDMVAYRHVGSRGKTILKGSGEVYPPIDRESEKPYEVFPDGDVRAYYAGQWVDFRNGEIVVTEDAPDNDSRIEVYVRPVESPSFVFFDRVRLFYAGQWVDFQNGQVLKTRV